MLGSIALAFQKCPKLSNLVIECFGQQHGFGINERQDRFYHDLRTLVNERMRFSYQWCLESMRFDIWDILKSIHDVNGTLNSLVLLDISTKCVDNWNMPPTKIFCNLKHLRHLGWSINFLPQILACAPELESLGVDGSLHAWISCSLQSIIGKSLLRKLRACSFNHLVLEQDDLAQFLLRHSNTLQDLRITKETWYNSIDWSSFVERMRGQLPYLRGLEDSYELWTWSSGCLSGPQHTPLLTGADLMQDHEHGLKAGPMAVEDGLWEEYEKVFFPEKFY